MSASAWTPYRGETPEQRAKDALVRERRETVQPDDGPLVVRAMQAGLTNARGVAEAIEAGGGCWRDVKDLADIWARVAQRNGERADVIRREAAELARQWALAEETL